LSIYEHLYKPQFMNEKNQEESNLDALIERMAKLQEENNVKACDLDAPESCETCSG